MGIFSKRFLLSILFTVIMCEAIFWPEQVGRAAEATQHINSVSVEITKATESPPTSQVQLRWQAVPSIANGSICYDIEKSTDGGLTFEPVSMGTNITALTWIDNNVPDFTNVIYQVRSKETVGGKTTLNPVSSPVKVFTPNINVHDNYMSNTNLCRNCHSTHTAKADKLLNESASTSGFCLTCHAGSTNSKYDVNSGNTMTGDGNKSSLGGVFNNATTAHREHGSPMECTNCHSAHDTGNYRMLKNSSIGVNVVAGAKANDPSQGETPVYISGTESFCQSCHADAEFKFVPGGSGHPLNTALTGLMTTTLSLEGNKMTCLTCHYSHGSTSANLTVSPGNALCLKCHTTTESKPNSEFSNESNLNLHKLIDSSEQHLDCSSCHVSHGDFIGGESQITRIDIESRTNHLWYYDSCTTSCHRPGSGA